MGLWGWVVIDLGPSFLAAEREAGVNFLAQLLSTSETFIKKPCLRFRLRLGTVVMSAARGHFRGLPSAGHSRQSLLWDLGNVHALT